MKNKSVIKIFLLVFLLAGIIFNVSANNKKGKNIALSITKTNDKNQKTNYFNLGIMSNYKYLNGASINILSDISQYNTKGVQLSGLVNIVGYKSNTTQIAGLANITGNKAYGIRISGLTNISGNSASGFQLSGLGNISGRYLKGVNISGLLNMSSRGNSGLLIAGLANISGKKQDGVSVSGLMNVNGEDLKGVQIASILNITGKTNYGIQFSAIGNINIENNGVQFGIISNYSASNKGLQIGLTNLSDKPSRSLQLGILNISKDSCNVSRQIGVVNIKPDTHIQIIASSGNINKANVGVRFKNKMIYTQLATGLIIGDITDKASISATYRTGLSFPIIGNRLNINTDIGYSHIETLNNNNIPSRLYSIQPRIEAEFSFSKNIGLFVSGGYSWTRTYKNNSSFSKDPLFEVGIILF